MHAAWGKARHHYVIFVTLRLLAAPPVLVIADALCALAAARVFERRVGAAAEFGALAAGAAALRAGRQLAGRTRDALVGVVIGGLGAGAVAGHVGAAGQLRLAVAGAGGAAELRLVCVGGECETHRHRV